METFINKMRKLKGIRKMILIEEAWKAITKEDMADYIRFKVQYLFIFAGELPCLFVVFVGMFMAGVNQWVCILLG